MFFYDIKIKGRTDITLKLLLNPTLSSVQRGEIKKGDSILLESIAKIEFYGNFFLLSKFTKLHFDVKNLRFLPKLSNYKQANGLGSSILHLPNLDLMSLNYILIDSFKNLSFTKKKPKNDGFTLKNLDNTWTGLKIYDCGSFKNYVNKTHWFAKIVVGTSIWFFYIQFFF